MIGWIRLHRSIKEHWIYNDEKKLKWWIDILLTVNHKDNSILIKGQLIECKRGQSVRSLDTWAKDWNTTKKTVSLFLKLLEKDKMIFVENLKISTRLTVCNYDSYQDSVNGEETLSKRTLPSNNNDNNVKKEK